MSFDKSLKSYKSTGLLIGWIICTYFVVQIVLGIMDGLKEVNTELATKFAKHLDNIIHRVRVEKDKDTYYWYDSDDGKFLAQGATDEEIIDSLKARFPQHIFYLPTNHLICAKHDWKPVLAPLTKNP